ncbi:MAG: hypothetical protein R6V10_00405 [bacterium]
MEVKLAIINKVSSVPRRLEPKEVEDEVREETGASEQEVKRAMHDLVMEGKLEFTYYGKNYVELPVTLLKSGQAVQGAKNSP